MIPLFKPTLDQAEIKAVAAVLRSGWIGSGPKVEEFETKFARLVGVKYAVAVSSASSALQLAIQSLNLPPQSHIISPSLTFIATNHAILLNQLKPIFCDVDPDTLCTDPDDVAKRITSKTRAIIAMHYGGHPADLKPLIKFCRQHKLALIEDCAHATGSYYYGQHVGSFGTMGCFSFAAIKNLTTGDGGMIVTNKKSLADRLKLLRWSGISKDTWHRTNRKKYSWQYDVVEISGKHQMNDIAAAIGLVQLNKLSGTNAKRQKLSQRYNKLLADISWASLPTVKSWAVSSHHNFCLKVPPRIRNRLIDYLISRGISTSVHYVPSHHYKLYRPFAASLPITDSIWRQILLLPLYPTVTLAEQDKVIAALHQFKP